MYLKKQTNKTSQYNKSIETKLIKEPPLSPRTQKKEKGQCIKS